MRRQRLFIMGGLAALLAASAGLSGANAGLPQPEPNALATVTPLPCKAEAGNVFEEAQYQAEGWSADDGYTRYGADCQRMRFSYGPILVKPGQNDVLLQPVAIEKPQYAGYMVRMRPDLVVIDSQKADAVVPPIEQIHLHHATWLSSFKDGFERMSPDWTKTRPWFASGEEKTIADVPRGYGMPMSPVDDWQILYMIHNQTAQSYEAYITYDIDYLPKAAAEQRWGMKAAYPIWLDVGPSDPANFGYPVFNVQRKYGDDNDTCTWPAEMCSDIDPWGGTSSNNGVPDPDRKGTDFRLPNSGGRLGPISQFRGGTIVGLGGHLHPGGVSDDIDLVRNGVAKRIFTSEAKYWDHVDRDQPTGPKNSWDLSMTWTGLPRWAVHVKPGDIIRINATYDTSQQSTYENMGIAIAFMAPDQTGQPPVGLDPFDPTVQFNTTSTEFADCLTARTICDKGVVTHGHMPEASNYGGGGGGALNAMPGQVADAVHMADFLYTPGDFGTIGLTGIPQVRLGQKLQFVNEDAAIDVYHTATSCAAPCTGATGIAFPLANAPAVDFDSTQLGVGLPYIGAASNQVTWDLSVDATSGFEAGETYTYFCRVHPFMRGAFGVTE